MVKYSCQNCGKEFKQKGHYDFHMNRKTPCKKDMFEKQVNKILEDTQLGLFFIRPYENIKEHVDNVLNKDTSHFKSSNDEPTPVGCIEEMISKIPETFWKQSNLKILDPCCGNGNFGVVVGNYLRENGKSNNEILQSLHFNDTNDSRIENVKKIFGNSAITTSNDFLKCENEEIYDMVMMNPPYAKLMLDGSRASKNHGLSISFMKKGLDSLKPGGFLVAIVPDNWMSLADRNSFCEEITKYQFHCLNIHCAKYWFPKVGSSFTWFVLEKTYHISPFEVSCLWKKTVTNETVNSQIRSYIPLLYSSKVQSIFRKTIDNDSLLKYKVETSSNLHRYTQRNLIQAEQTDEFCYRLIHTPKQTVYANRAHKFQDGWKVFLSTTDKYLAFPDNCGMTQSIAFIKVDSEDNAKSISNKLMHPLYVFLNNVCRYGNFNNTRIMQKFPVSITDNPFVEFGITLDEIEYISSHL